MSTRVIRPTRDELERRRTRLLARAGMDRDELEAAAGAGTLTSDQYWTWEDIQSIEFLLGDDGGA